MTGGLVHDAWKRLDHVVHQTPIRTSATTNLRTGKNIYFKMENQQKTGAFKFRGASYKLMRLSRSELDRGVITASAGNHAQGLALAAYKLGVKATIYMAEATPEAKVQATRGYGAEVILTGESFQEAYEASLKQQERCGATYVHPFDDYDIMAGQGTVALELLQQENRIDTIVVPIGGGGLISGIAVAAKSVNPDIKVIGVQAAAAPAMHTAYHRGVIQKLDKVSTIAEGIAVKQPGEKTLPFIKNYVDDVITVSEEEIADAMVNMLERGKSLVEGAGASAFAGLLSHNDQISSRHCGVIVSGGNFDISRMADIQSLANQLKPEQSHATLAF
ncbi:threonine dehydratase [Salinicoccus halodurans]|uniref:L-threonine dehydratase catabolic TdcB n=1 Tax=Salinicoccus halodurans TaxID=407035 RepID=A0ABN4FZJ0_9STAP|nr:threonine ammonia-lyase [Salinicoccus halodurans]AKG73669.1 threonine dehydratase [Salinicoccus halodurans]